MKSVFFHQAAKEELLISRDYYDELVFGLGKSFVIEVERCLNIIKLNPLAYPTVRQNIRKAVIMKFPFSILYKPEDENVYILAIMHQNVSPTIGVNEYKKFIKEKKCRAFQQFVIVG